MWAVFTYIYNSILIIFIAIHLLVGALITFCVGVYIGIYLSQNYQIPRIDEPFKLWSYFVKFIEQRRKPGGMSIFPSANKNRGDKDKVTGDPKNDAQVKVNATTTVDPTNKGMGSVDSLGKIMMDTDLDQSQSSLSNSNVSLENSSDHYGAKKVA